MPVSASEKDKKLSKKPASLPEPCSQRLIPDLARTSLDILDGHWTWFASGLRGFAQGTEKGTSKLDYALSQLVHNVLSSHTQGVWDPVVLGPLFLPITGQGYMRGRPVEGFCAYIAAIAYSVNADTEDNDSLGSLCVF